MRLKRSPAAAVIALLLSLCAVSRAQEVARLAEPEAGALAAQTRGVYGFERAAHEFGFWGGGSFSSPTVVGSTERVRLGLVAFRYARVLSRGENMAVKYTLDAVPVASLSFPVFEATAAGGVREVRRTITGAGLAPVGFQVNFRRRERVQPFAQVSGGFLYLGERVPDARGAQFNFTGDVGGGVQWKTGGRRAWTVGYRYHHISNGYRADVNPGFDSNLFYVGFSIFR